MSQKARGTRWRWAGLLGTWLVVVALLVLAFREAAPDQIFEVLRRLQPAQVLALFGINLIFLGLVNLRWWILLRSLGQRVPITALLVYRLAGFALSYFTPGPQFGGEPLQAFLLKKRSNIPADAAVSSVFLDRIVDLLSNFLFLLFGSLVITLTGVFHDWAGSWSWAAALALLLGPAGHLLALRLGYRPAARLVQAARRWQSSRIAGLLCRSEEQVAEIVQKKPATLLIVMAISGLVWCIAVLEFWMLINFLGLRAEWNEVIAALTAARLALLVPVPGGLGALETSQFLAASMLGWGAAAGIAISLIIRARDVSLALIGLLIGFSFSRSLLFRVTR